MGIGMDTNLNRGAGKTGRGHYYLWKSIPIWNGPEKEHKYRSVCSEK